MVGSAPSQSNELVVATGKVLLPLGWELYAAEALACDDVDGLTHLFRAVDSSDINTRVRSDRDPMMPVLNYGRYSASIFARKPVTAQRGDTLLDLAHRTRRSAKMKYRIRELGGRAYNFRAEEAHERRQYERWLASKREDRRRAAMVGMRVLSTTLRAKIDSIEAADRACSEATAIAERNSLLRASFERNRIVQARWEWRKTAEESLTFSARDVGLQLSIMWAGGGGPRAAKVTNYDPATQMHAVRYSSGNVKVYDLRRKRFRVTGPAVTNGKVTGNGRAIHSVEHFRQTQERLSSSSSSSLLERPHSRHGPSTAILQTHKVVGPGPAFAHVFANVKSSNDSGVRVLQVPNHESGIEARVVLTDGNDPEVQPPRSPLRRKASPPILPILAEKIRQILWLPGTSFEEVVEQAAETLGIVGSSVHAKYELVAKELKLHARDPSIHLNYPILKDDETRRGNTFGLFGPRGTNYPVSSRTNVPNLDAATTLQAAFDEQPWRDEMSMPPPPPPPLPSTSIDQSGGRVEESLPGGYPFQRARAASVLPSPTCPLAAEEAASPTAKRRSSMPAMPISCPPKVPQGSENAADGEQPEESADAAGVGASKPSEPGSPKAAADAVEATEGEGEANNQQGAEIGSAPPEPGAEDDEAAAAAAAAAAVPLTPLTPATPMATHEAATTPS